MQEEQDTCRICSAPAEPDQPLFYPCKCSGTIRYIHQDCLTTWLAHSRKRTCDVCKHPYSFAKVYDPNMPDTLPFWLVIRRVVQQIFFMLVFILRAIVVALIWLALLPWITMWTWRMYFLVGDSTAWWIADRPRPDILDSLLTSTNTTSVSNGDAVISTPLTNSTLFTRVISHPAWATVSADIFGGQIISSSIIISFVAIFLLREWILQNARPGVFEDADPPPPIVQDPPVLEMPEPEDEPGPDDEVDVMQPSATPNSGSSLLEGHDDAGEELPDGSDSETKVRRRVGVQDTTFYESDQEEEPRARKGRKREPQRRTLRRERALRSSPEASGSGLPSTFEFTFENGSFNSTTHTSMSTWPPAFDFTFESTPSGGQVMLPSHQRRSSSEPPTVGSSPPFASDGTRFMRRPAVGDSSSAEPSHSFKTPPPGVDPQLRAIPPSIPNFPRRPPLPASAVPSPLGTPSSGFPNGSSPLASPGLATYQAPEELEASIQSSSSFVTPIRLDKGKGKERAATPDFSDTSSSRILNDSPEALQHAREHYFRPVIADEPSKEQPDPVVSDTEDGDSVPDHAPDGQAHMEELERHFLIDEEDEEDGEEDDEAGELDGIEGAPFAELWEGREPDVERARLVEEVDRMEAELRELQRERAELEQLEAMVEDDGDLDGMLELVGFRGPFSAVIQNATLVIFALDTAIGLGIWLPFMVGKSTALLSMDPPRLLCVVQTPIRIMRVITDPVVDSLETFFIYPLARLLRKSIHSLSILAGNATLSLIAKAFGPGSESRVQKYAEFTLNRVQEELQVAWATTPSTNEEATIYEGLTAAMDNVLSSDVDIVRWVEPHFATLGKRVRLLAMQGQAKWARLALGTGTQEKIFAIALGYAVFTFLLALYLNVLTMGTMRSAGRAVRSTVRQQLLVAKVGIFVLIEVVAFPLGCGIVLDIATIWLRPGSTLKSDRDFALFAPTTSSFYHWLLGTIFMYQFAIVLNGCRRVMRPGALWFIKDPQDQNFHPIRDIIERSSITQIRKLLLSAEMYAVVIGAGVATIGGFLQLSPLLPFRWKIREPLSNVPVDLVIFIVLMPYTMRFLRPSKPLRRWTRRIWRRLSAQLRLSSFMFGKRYPLEEFTPTEWSIISIFKVQEGMEVQDAEGLRDGGFNRVPASDSIAIGNNALGAAHVDEFGNPVDERNARLMQLQDNETMRANRDILQDYTVVYIPPHFRFRIGCFIAMLWVIGSAFAATVITVPTLLGRAAFSALLNREVHDGYSFLAGFYLLWGAWIIGKSLDRMDKRRQRERDWKGPRADWALWVAKRVLRWSVNISYMIIALGFILPTLVAIVVELYIVLPLRLTVDPTLPVRIRLIDMWMLGILYTKIVLRIRRIQARSPFMRGVDRILRNGWTHPDPRRATEEVIGPLVGGALGIVILPVIFVTLARKLGFVPINDKFLLMHVYPGVFAAAGLTSSILTLTNSWESWTQSVREKEFLVEMRLQNLEPNAVQDSGPSAPQTPELPVPVFAEEEREEELEEMVDSDEEEEDAD